MPITGALVGECGLRPRAGRRRAPVVLRLALEPVGIDAGLADPLLGTTRVAKKIFPAMSLVDWSAG